MIRINLLETAKGKNKRAGGSSGPVMPAMEMGDMGSPRLKVLAVVVLAGLLNFGYWYRLDRQAQSIAKQMQSAEQKNRELSDVKARYLERQTQANNYKRRVEIIDSLRCCPVWRAGQSAGHAGRNRERNRSRLVEEDGRHGPDRKPGRHGAERGCGGQPDREPAENRVL